MGEFGSRIPFFTVSHPWRRNLHFFFVNQRFMFWLVGFFSLVASGVAGWTSQFTLNFAMYSLDCVWVKAGRAEMRFWSEEGRAGTNEPARSRSESSAGVVFEGGPLLD